MKAKDFVRRIKEIDTTMRIKNEELLRLREKAGGVGGYMDGERVQSTRTISDKMADEVVRYIDLRDEMVAENFKLAKERHMIVNTLGELEPVEYDVLYSKYASGATFDDIADRYGKSYRWAVAKHGAALKNLQKIIDGKGIDENYWREN